MTDTPRTQAELLALFADNNAGEISAQDMRDFVASVSIDKSRHAFVARRRNNSQLDGLYDPYSKGSVSVVGGGNDVIVDWSGADSLNFYDPDGWLNTSPVADTGYWGNSVDPWPVGTVFTLPPGTYIWQAMVQMSSAPTSGYASVYLDVTDDPANAPTPLLQAQPSLGDSESVPADMSNTTLAFTFGGYVTDAPTNVMMSVFGDAAPAKTLHAVTLTIARA